MLKRLLLMAVCCTFIGPAFALDAAEQNEIVAAHNKWRKTVGVPPVTWSPRLAQIAQSWANKGKASGNCDMEHSKTDGVGENLFWASAKEWSDGKRDVQAVTSAFVTDAWSSERKDYTYNTDSCARGQACGHYTQVVWKSTQEVGCAKAVCADKSQIWVCNYSPPGNYVGQKPY